MCVCGSPVLVVDSALAVAICILLSILPLIIYYYYFRGPSSGQCRDFGGRQNSLSARSAGRGPLSLLFWPADDVNQFFLEIFRRQSKDTLKL